MREKACNVCGQTKNIQACKSRVNRKQRRDYICIFDPSGTYLEGSQLTYGQVTNTLAAGFMPPGSRWMLAKVEYVVKGNEHWHNIIECVRDPDKTYLESVRERQRLVRI